MYHLELTENSTLSCMYTKGDSLAVLDGRAATGYVLWLVLFNSSTKIQDLLSRVSIQPKAPDNWLISRATCFLFTCPSSWFQPISTSRCSGHRHCFRREQKLFWVNQGNFEIQNLRQEPLMLNEPLSCDYHTGDTWKGSIRMANIKRLGRQVTFKCPSLEFVICTLWKMLWLI